MTSSAGCSQCWGMRACGEREPVVRHADLRAKTTHAQAFWEMPDSPLTRGCPSSNASPVSC